MQGMALLKRHWELFYRLLGERGITSSFEERDGMKICLSHLADPYHNAVIGSPVPPELGEKALLEQVDFFLKNKVPFVWYIEEGDEFKTLLLQRGFRHVGTFRAVQGKLDENLLDPEIPTGYTIEHVDNRTALAEQLDLVCSVFHMQHIKKPYVDLMWQAAQDEKIFHWVVRREGKVVAALSTIIEGEGVSFWNGATLSEERRKGLSTALRKVALRHAISRGCRWGMSYIMADGQAYGICRQLGYKTRWQFQAFLSP